MQHKTEFLRYEETPEAKHMGIAQVRIEGIVVLKFKVVPKQDGGFFVAGPSYKRETPDGDKWSQWFMLDSMSFNEEVQEFITDNVQNFLRSRQEAPQQENANHPGQLYAQKTDAAQGQQNVGQAQPQQDRPAEESLPF